MIGHCTTCRYWLCPPGRYDTDDMCDRENGVGVCDKIEHCDDFSFPKPSPGEAMTQDAERYASSLYTHAQFGCTLWAAKITEEEL